MKNEQIHVATHFNVLRPTIILIRLSSNFYEVEDRINDAILDLTGMRNLGLIAVKNAEKYERVRSVRWHNMRARRKTIYKALLPFAPANVKKSKLYKEAAQFWGLDDAC